MTAYAVAVSRELHEIYWITAASEAEARDYWSEGRRVHSEEVAADIEAVTVIDKAAS